MHSQMMQEQKVVTDPYTASESANFPFDKCGVGSTDIPHCVGPDGDY